MRDPNSGLDDPALKETSEDSYRWVVQSIQDGQTFQLSRWNDGELFCVVGRGGANCDGHEYFESLQLALVDILAKPQRYEMGLGALGIGIARELKIIDRFRWRNASAFCWGLRHDKLESFLAALEGRAVTLVGTDHLKKVADHCGWKVVDVPARNAWNRIQLFDRQTFDLAEERSIVVLACGPGSCVVVERLFEWRPDLTVIDIGSCLDPFGGVVSRSYQHGLEWLEK